MTNNPEELQIMLRQSCEDWAEDHTYLEQLCLKAGYSEDDVYGDSYCAPDIQGLGDMLFKKINEK